MAGTSSLEGANSRDMNLSFVPAQMPSQILGRNGTVAYSFTGLGEERKAKVWTAEDTRSIESEIIVAYKPWLITLCIASMVLILTSLISPALHHFLIKGPEVMMNPSSLAARPHRLARGRDILRGLGPCTAASKRLIRHGDVGRQKYHVGNLVIGAVDRYRGRATHCAYTEGKIV